MTEPILSIKDLSVAFTQAGKTNLAVDRVSFDIHQGETVALVGESGSGKSVSALSILKLLPYPAASHPSGAIHFKGENLLDNDERDLRRVRGNDITMIFQEPMSSLNPLHTIEHQIGEILELHQGMDDREARLRTLEMLHANGYTMDVTSEPVDQALHRIETLFEKPIGYRRPEVPTSLP